MITRRVVTGRPRHVMARHPTPVDQVRNVGGARRGDSSDRQRSAIITVGDFYERPPAAK